MGCCCWLYRNPQVLGSAPGPVTGEVPAFAGGPEIGPYVAGLYPIVVCGRGGGTGASACPTTGRAGTRHSGCDGGSGGGLPYMVARHRSGCKRCKTGERGVKRCLTLITLLPNDVSRWSFSQGVSDCCVGLERGRSATRQPHPRRLLQDHLRCTGNLRSTSCYYYHVSTSKTPAGASPVYCKPSDTNNRNSPPTAHFPSIGDNTLVQLLCPKYRLHTNEAFPSFLCLRSTHIPFYTGNMTLDKAEEGPPSPRYPMSQ